MTCLRTNFVSPVHEYKRSCEAKSAPKKHPDALAADASHARGNRTSMLCIILIVRRQPMLSIPPLSVGRYRLILGVEHNSLIYISLISPHT